MTEHQAGENVPIHLTSEDMKTVALIATALGLESYGLDVTTEHGTTELVLTTDELKEAS